MTTPGSVTAGAVVYEFRGDATGLRTAAAEVRAAMAAARAEAASFGQQAVAGTGRATAGFADLASEVREGVAALRRLEAGQAAFNREVLAGVAEMRTELALIRELATAHLMLAAAERQSASAGEGLGRGGASRGGVLAGFAGGVAAGLTAELSTAVQQLPRAAREATRELAELGREAARLDVPVGLLRELQDAAERAGVSASDLSAALDEVATRGRNAFASRDLAEIYDEAAAAAARTSTETAEIVRQATELDLRWTEATQTLRDEMLPTLQNVDSSMVSIVEWGAAFVRTWREATAAAQSFMTGVGNWGGWDTLSRLMHGVPDDGSARSALMLQLRQMEWGARPTVPTRDEWLRTSGFTSSQADTSAARASLAAQLGSRPTVGGWTDWLRGSGSTAVPTAGGGSTRAGGAPSLPELRETLPEVRAEVDRLSTAATEAGRSLASAFEQAAFSGGSLREILAGLSQDFGRIVYGMTARPFVESVGSSFFSSVLSGFGSGGSSVSLPLPKPQLAAPAAAAASAGPAARTASASAPISISLYAQDAQSVMRSEAQVTSTLARAVARGRRGL